MPGPRRLALLDPPEDRDGGRGGGHDGGRGDPRRVLVGALAALRSLARTTEDDVGPLGLQGSAAFASRVEELSRTLDYLQLAVQPPPPSDPLIQVRTGLPWFIPPPHIDPRQRPRKNRYFQL
ncbi:hypothetical protein [Arthrobacter sp. efr-133-R2A-63]|uniref:hypothetical protein n=1 Tax=Arthrobacter sp. efr-133-R2A-63 TaxID=3040278 RepID=UPI00254B4E2F|nr:hypothetical protein [Arthrobacter sp. efr-133-R2A-63]